MTFKQWLTDYYAEDGGYAGEYSGTLAALEDAWNAGVKAAGATHLISTEFRHKFRPDDHAATGEDHANLSE